MVTCTRTCLKYAHALVGSDSDCDCSWQDLSEDLIFFHWQVGFWFSGARFTPISPPPFPHCFRLIFFCIPAKSTALPERTTKMVSTFYKIVLKIKKLCFSENFWGNFVFYRRAVSFLRVKCSFFRCGLHNESKVYCYRVGRSFSDWLKKTTPPPPPIYSDPRISGPFWVFFLCLRYWDRTEMSHKRTLDWLIDYWICWICCFSVQSIDGLIDWLIVRLIESLSHWGTDWLIDWKVFSSKLLKNCFCVLRRNGSFVLLSESLMARSGCVIFKDIF